MEHKRAVAPTWRWRSHVVVDKTTSPQTGQFVVDKKHNQELKSLSHLRLDHACAMGTSSVGEHAVVIAAAKTIFCVRTMQFKKPSGSPVLWHHPVQGTTQGLHWLDQMRVLRAYDDGGGRGAISVLRAPISAPTQEMFFDALSGTHKTLIQSLAINTFDVGQVITGAQDGSVLALDLNHGGGCVLEQTQHKGAITSLLLPDDCNCGVCPSFTVGDNQGSFRVADLRQGLRHLGFEASMGQPVRQHVRLDHHQVVLSGLQDQLFWIDMRVTDRVLAAHEDPYVKEIHHLVWDAPTAQLVISGLDAFSCWKRCGTTLTTTAVYGADKSGSARHDVLHATYVPALSGYLASHAARGLLSFHPQSE